MDEDVEYLIVLSFLISLVSRIESRMEEVTALYVIVRSSLPQLVIAQALLICASVEREVNRKNDMSKRNLKLIIVQIR